MGIVAGRVLFTLLIFSILFGGSQLLLKNYARNVRIAISLILGLISGLAIPGDLVKEVFQMYGGVFYALMVAGPLLGAAYLIFKVFDGTERFDYVAKFIIAGVAAYVGTAMSGGVAGLVGAGQQVGAGLIWTGLDSIFTMVGVAFGVLTVYYAYKAIFPNIEEVEMPEGTKKALGRWWRRRGRDDFNKEPGLLRDIENDIRNRVAVAKIKKKLRKSDKIMKRIEELVARSHKDIQDHIESAADRTTAQGYITAMAAPLRAFETAMDAVEAAIDSTPPNWATARSRIKTAKSRHNILISQEVNFLKAIGAA